MSGGSFTIEMLRSAKAKVDALPKGPAVLRFVRSPFLVVGPFEDWSQVRSRGRAARRRAQGHPQRIRLFYKPDPKLLHFPDGTVVGHPEIIDGLERSLRAETS